MEIIGTSIFQRHPVGTTLDYDRGMSSRKKSPPPCSNCGRHCEAQDRKFCSRSCQWEADFKRRSALLEKGLYPPAHQGSFLKRYLIRKLGECCSACGWAERHPLTKKVPVEVEHIDGNWQNNRIENLTLLCPNHHSLTPTYRGLNRGKGRARRLGGRENPLRLRSPRSIHEAVEATTSNSTI
jgi:hypothetical protein